MVQFTLLQRNCCIATLAEFAENLPCRAPGIAVHGEVSQQDSTTKLPQGGRRGSSRSWGCSLQGAAGGKGETRKENPFLIMSLVPLLTKLSIMPAVKGRI